MKFLFEKKTKPFSLTFVYIYQIKVYILRMAIGAIKCVQLLIYVCTSARETRSATLHTSNKQAF